MKENLQAQKMAVLLQKKTFSCLNILLDKYNDISIKESYIIDCGMILEKHFNELQNFSNENEGLLMKIIWLLRC